ncbi:MAG: DnaA/Hda family protein [Pseudomonadota bacterium]
MARQLSFDLPVRTALGREDFFVSDANKNAVALIEAWQNWPDRKLALIAPEGAGKTHLVHVWADMSQAQIVSAHDLGRHDIPALGRAPCAVEDCEGVSGSPEAERALLHLHNLALAEGQSLLLTARAAPRDWNIALPDLASRMQATPTIAITAPDDALLSAVLMKHFQDRQIFPPPDLVPYLARRMDRSFAAARDVVDRLDRLALHEQRTLTRGLARRVLDNPDK